MPFYYCVFWFFVVVLSELVFLYTCFISSILTECSYYFEWFSPHHRRSYFLCRQYQLWIMTALFFLYNSYAVSFSLLITLTSTLSTAMNRNIFSGCPSHIPHFKYMAWLQVCMPSEQCLTSGLPSQLTWHYCLVIWLCLVSVYSQVKFSLLSVIYLSIFRFVLIIYHYLLLIMPFSCSAVFSSI